MPGIEKTLCNYCGSQFLVIFEEEEEELKFCPSCGEDIDNYIDHDDEDGLWNEKELDGEV
jgi:rRNA maturation endonuclease Nob1|tara:strand:- start:2 stop:181 length:180 start_codon:yes stop_codon:yes gene_type:complete